MNLHDLILIAADREPDAAAVHWRDREIGYASLAEAVRRAAGGLIAAGLPRGGRVAVYLPKQPETVTTAFAAGLAGGVFVPVNPQLKPPQVGHILRDCGATVLVTSAARAATLRAELAECRTLERIVICDGSDPEEAPGGNWLAWSELAAAEPASRRVIDADLAALMYTSGSTGRPKGVMLSHRNLVSGARSVAGYLDNRPGDRLLTVLPFSFDYGFSQLTTAFACGASVVLFDYLLARDVVRAVVRHGATGLACVPPVWMQLARLDWPEAATRQLRYVTNSGGALPHATLAALRERLPETKIFLMYGLTEAFRSTYLDPAELARRPGSIGKAIPNAEVLVVRPDGSPCAPNEPGELVHRGALVALGYWNDPERTAQRFRPSPVQPAGATLPEIAVWSGDTVRTDDEGFLYFVGRRDEQIKTSGYRVSPTEIEEVLYDSGLVREAVAFGVPHPELGQAIVAVAVAEGEADTDGLLRHCRDRLANYQIPGHVAWRTALPRNANGKLDRAALAGEFAALFKATSA